jgi:hypothetical protein
MEFVAFMPELTAAEEFSGNCGSQVILAWVNA